ncbi:hypothetical protein RJ640_030293, partial [Escallonia rubra]
GLATSYALKEAKRRSGSQSMDNENDGKAVRILCRKLVLINNETGLQWLIGSPFFPPLTIASTFRCIHTLPSNPLSPDFPKESDDLRTLLLKGFEVIGALIAGNNLHLEQNAGEAIDAVRKLRKALSSDTESRNLIGGVVDWNRTEDVRFFVSRSGDTSGLESVSGVAYEDEGEKYVWERGCLLRCELPIKLPLYYSVNSPKAEDMFTRATEAVAARFRDPKVTYIMETLNERQTEAPEPLVIRGGDLDFQAELSSVSFSSETDQVPDVKSTTCSYFCSTRKDTTSFTSVEEVTHRKSNRHVFLAAMEETKLLVVNFKLEVLCYAAKDLPLKYAVSKIIIPGLVDQLYTMKNIISPELLTRHPQLNQYHFNPPGFLHPVSVIYELNYGETEIKQVEVRKSLHLRLGLPFDRPLLRIANAINLSLTKSGATRNSTRKGNHSVSFELYFVQPMSVYGCLTALLTYCMVISGSSLLKDVHLGIPSSGVSGGVVSLIQGSYEYHHYLQDGFDDSDIEGNVEELSMMVNKTDSGWGFQIWEGSCNGVVALRGEVAARFWMRGSCSCGQGWGCAYRSLQTIISWFRLQHYTSIDVPSHREIQQSLVEIGDKDPSFTGSHDWIGAIELSFVLDKLLGVSCKIINVRSGDELPEKCRELALHFENQGTPIMIGGGVLAYTLLGVDFNESSGDCAFLILDPHYTGNDELKKIVNGGWCGWKKAVDSKGKHFFLHDKFYNLLLPQRPNMV